MAQYRRKHQLRIKDAGWLCFAVSDRGNARRFALCPIASAAWGCGLDKVSDVTAKSGPVRKPRAVRLHAGPREAVMPALDALNRWFDLDGVVIGGGTALEARWHHRRSTDLDLFGPVPYLAALMKLPRERVQREFRDHVARTPQGTDSLLALDALDALGTLSTTQLRFAVAGVPVSLSGTRGFWKEDHDPCVEASTGMPLAPSADILMRKMQGRLLTQGLALPRDAYDFVVAHALDPISFRDALAQLDEHQAGAIAETFEVLANTPQKAQGRGIEAPAYPSIMDRGLWTLACQVFRDPQRVAYIQQEG